ncbi:MAG: hypothetical protein R3C11_13515 [Planctomycetaceae bacterium]
MTKAGSVHSYWIDSYETNQKELTLTKEKNQSLAKEKPRVEGEYDRLIQRWYQSWDNVNTVSNGDSHFCIDAGSNNGIPAPGDDPETLLYEPARSERSG